MNFSIKIIALSMSALGAALSSPAFAAEEAAYTLNIRNHTFQPSELSVPANTKFRLVVKNEDPTPEEFESHDLKREKVIPGMNQAVIVLGPLKPGTYRFVGEYHEKTAKGVLVAK